MHYSDGLADVSTSVCESAVNTGKSLTINEASRKTVSFSRMCDLIDLNSPNVKGLVNSKLASPLIPVPKNVESNKQANLLVTDKHENLDNNPFDSVLHKTTEYVTKKGDPFEVMLQRALNFKGKQNTELKAQPVGFMDDFTPTRKKRYQKLMNKTLDESLIKGNVGSIDEEKKKEDFNVIASNVNVTCDGNTAENNKLILEQSIMILDADPLELSILNQSAMNDTLLEADLKHKVDNEISTFLEIDPSFRNFALCTSSNPKPHFQRSLSQGCRKLSRELPWENKKSLSVADTLRNTSECDSTLSFLNKGFLESEQSEQSVFSNLSNVSSVARSNSFSSMSNLPSVSSDTGIKNNAFVGSNELKMSNDRINTAENSMEIKSVQYDLSDLTERLNKLKCAIDRTTSTLSTKEDINKSNSIKGEDDKHTTSDKLIDVDIFSPESAFSREDDKSTNSISSSDSVFTDNSKVDKSILNEAKALARTFEKLAVKTDSGSSTDDLISNNPLWMSELLPAYEDEVVDNLIDLPVSPKKNLKIDKSNDLNKSASTDNAKEDLMKKMEPQFADNVSTVRQTMITTLLDLKKLVRAENNPEASKLIDNLESILSVECKNNMELLASLNVSNKLQNSEMSDDKLDNTEQSVKTSNNKSQKENKQVLSEEKINDDESSLQHISNKSKDTLQATTVSSDNLLARTSLCDNNSENCLNITNSPKTALKDSHLDEKLAVELLINLGKLLSGQAEDASTLKLLKSIGKALNAASNNCKIEGELQMDDNSRNIQRITSVKTSKSDSNAALSSAKKTAHEQSFNSKFKPHEKAKRSSMSAIHSSNANTSNTSVNAKRKSTSASKVEKRVSNNSGFVSTMENKKIPISEASNAKIVETTDSKKEKSLAIIDVKNKLKKKFSTVNNKGPMKAVHPVGTMQKKPASLGKQTAPSSEITTPPKSHTAASGSKIISSTPNSIGSSTPDSQNNRSSKMQLSINKKRNLSCDISPVTVQNSPPKRPSRSPIVKKHYTPKRQQADLSGIPKYCTPPRLNSSLDMNRHQQQSPQYLNKSLTGCQRYSPIRPKSVEKKLRSPLKDNNKIFTKVKPLKLISKLKRSTVSDFAEKENYSE